MVDSPRFGSRRIAVGELTPSASAPAAVAATVESRAGIEVAANASAAEWDSYVDSRPNSSVYHLAAWRSVFEQTFGHRTEYLAARRRGVIVGVLPLVEIRSWLFGSFAVSLPFVNYGGVLADDDEVARALFERAGRFAEERRLSYIELRHLAPQFPEAPSKRHKVTMKLPLAPDAEGMWAALDRKVRNQVRKAEKSGLVAEIGGVELVASFYPVFATNMRDLGTPVYPKRFFEEIVAALPDRTRLFVVRSSDGAVIAAGIGVRYRETLEMPWASSLKAHRALSPNNLLYWSALKYAILQGCTTFDFGRSTPNEGTFNFKQQWGAQPEPLTWEYRLLSRSEVPNVNPTNQNFGLAIRLWKRLPVALATRLGPFIVRAIP